MRNNSVIKISINEVCKIVNGTPYNLKDCEISKVCHIKRNIEKGALFFAMKTWRIDTYSNIVEAIEKGVAAIVTDVYIEGYPCIVVEDGYMAFMKLCEWWRRQKELEIVAITGSIGKTSTKEMIYHVLRKNFKAEKNDENSNSSDLAAMHIFDLKKETELLVQEVAIQDIQHTTYAIKPNVGVITNIGYSHVETFGSREGIFQKKIELIKGMNENGIAYLNFDDDMLKKYAGVCGKNVVTYSLENSAADCYARNIKSTVQGYKFDICLKGEVCPDIQLLCKGKHNILNAMVAYCIGRYYGVCTQDIIEGIAEFRPTGMRQHIFTQKGITVMADCFNASLESMKGALDTLEQLEIVGDGRKVAVLGDILELGKYSKTMHKDLGEFINYKKIDCVYLYGKEIEYARRFINNEQIEVKYFLKMNELLEELKISEMIEGNAILFKSSHGMELYKVIDILFGTSYQVSRDKYTHICSRLMRENDKPLEMFKNYNKVAIYGILPTSEEVVPFLRQQGLTVEYVIDQKAKFIPKGKYDLPLYSLEDELEPVDMVFITLNKVETSLKDAIKAKTGAEILTYDDLQ